MTKEKAIELVKQDRNALKHLDAHYKVIRTLYWPL